VSGTGRLGQIDAAAPDRMLRHVHVVVPEAGADEASRDVDDLALRLDRPGRADRGDQAVLDDDVDGLLAVRSCTTQGERFGHDCAPVDSLLTWRIRSARDGFWYGPGASNASTTRPMTSAGLS